MAEEAIRTIPVEAIGSAPKQAGPLEQAKPNGQAQPPTTEEDKPAPAANSSASWNGKLALRKAVNAHGEKVSEITFREPTAADIEAVGMPVLPNMRLDTQAMTQMMSRL